MLVGRHTIVPVTFTKAPLRRDDADLKRQYQADAADAAAAGPARATHRRHRSLAA